MATAYITHSDCLRHDMGSYHPESPSRLSAIHDRFIAQGLDNLLAQYDAPEVTREQLERIHHPDYLDLLESNSPPEGELVALDADTAIGPYTLAAARRAAGAGILATDLVMEREVSNAFCAVRPPGHHAEPDRAMGFCFYNNIAVAVAHALEHHGLQRVAIVDFDVHHGNGTESAFKDDERVLLCSTFQHPFYPYSEQAQRDHLIHVQLRAGTGSEEFRTAASSMWLLALEDFKPEMIFISAGFDAHIEDDLANLKLRDSDFGWVTRAIMKVADQYAQGRIVSTLEGGYNLDALARSCVEHVRALAGLDGDSD